MSQKHQRPKGGYTKRPAVDSRTKFDKWLDEQIEAGVELGIVFYEAPLEDGDDTYLIVTPKVCDRYFIQATFGGEYIWFAKQNVLSVKPIKPEIAKAEPEGDRPFGSVTEEA